MTDQKSTSAAGDTSDITSSLGATALGVAACRAAETVQESPLTRDDFAAILVDAMGMAGWAATGTGRHVLARRTRNVRTSDWPNGARRTPTPRWRRSDGPQAKWSTRSAGKPRWIVTPQYPGEPIDGVLKFVAGVVVRARIYVLASFS